MKSYFSLIGTKLNVIVKNVLLLMLVTLFSNAWSQQTAPRGSVSHPVTPRISQIAESSRSHIGNPHGHLASSVTTCDSNVLMDYAAYNEVLANNKGIGYNGSWYTFATGLYTNNITSFATAAYGDSAYLNYAGVAFDSLVFANPSTSSTAYSSVPLEPTTVKLDSLGLWIALQGDSTLMTNDSIVFFVYSITGGTLSASPVQEIVYHGWAQLRKFYQPIGYIGYQQINVGHQFTQGQGFAVALNYHNKNASTFLSLAYSYEDSCGTVVYNGSTIGSPAYPSPFPGNDFYGQIVDSSSIGIVGNYNNAYAFTGLGFPVNCSYVFEQNFAIIPYVTYCVSTPTPPAVITLAASAVTTNSATLNGTINANGTSTAATFQWGLTTSYTGGTVNATPATVTGSTTSSISYALSGLTPATTYHYRAVGNGTVDGADMTFTTLSNTSVCTPQAGVTSGIYATAANVPCASQGVAFSQTFTLYVPSNTTFQGTPVTIDSIIVNSITGLPTGLNWSANNNPFVIDGGTSGCFIVTGTTNAACGQYLMTITVTAYTNLGPFTLSSTSVGYSKEYIRVNTSGNSCLAVDTTQTTAFVANPSCTGTPPPTVSISNVGEVSCFGGSNGSATAVGAGGAGNFTYVWSNGQTTATASNLSATTYTVTVTSGGQTATASVTITQPASAVSASATSTQTSCSSNTGTATVTATGGTPGYTYLWSNSGTAVTISAIGVGNYTVTVTDSKSCTATASTSVNTSATFTVNVTSTNVNCFGGNSGTANAAVTGATGNLTYLWTGGATTQSISNLSAGTVSVTVTEVNGGCSKSGSATITQPATALSATAQATQTACSSNTGTILVTPTGGTPGYTYNWSNSTTANPAVGLGAGTLTGTVTDSKGCTSTVSGTVSLPPSFSASASAHNVTCFGQSSGSVTATVTGNGAYTYFWSNGGNSASITDVAAGPYTVTVTDGFGCTQTATATVTQPLSGVTASTTTTQTSCTSNSGTATVSASGGQNPYTYLWSNGGTTTTISNLAAGNYPVTVTDHSGCTVSTVASVSSPATFTLTLDSTNVLCYGANTGGVTASVSGGTQPYNYSWSNGATTSNLTGLTAGTFNVTVTDGTGCSKAASTTVNQPASALVANATATSSTCNTSSGTATVTVVGGTGSPTYQWNNSATTPTISNLGVGVYKVTVTEGNCTASSSAIVNNINGPTVTMLQTNPTCSYLTNGSASAVASQGTSPYSYTWNTTATGPNLNNIGAGTYTVVVADNTGCQATGSVTLVAPAPISFNPIVTNENCAGQLQGSIALSAGGGTGPYTYNWYNGTSQPEVGNLAAGNYAVTVTDSKQCTAVSTFNVSAPVQLVVTATATNSNSGANGSVATSVSGGTTPYLYEWSNSQTGSSDTGLVHGTFTVTVTDNKGCTATASASVIATGIDDISNVISSAAIIPNPASDLVNVVVQLESTQTIQFRVVDLTGKYLYTSNQITAQGRLTHEINVSDYAAGIYLVEISAGNQVIRERLMIAK